MKLHLTRLLLLSLIATLQFGCAVTYTREIGEGKDKPARTFSAGFRPTVQDYKGISRIINR